MSTFKHEPLISVIMPAYNADKYIKTAIDCVLNQTHKNIELLIADDASKDSTRQIIDAYNDVRIKTYHNNSNMGYLKTCNKLFEKAKGDYIAFQDADDLSTPDRFELQLQVLQSDASLGAVGCNLTAIDTKNNEMFCSHYPLKHEDILKDIPGYFPVIPNSYLFTREVYSVIGGYNLYFDRMGAEDYYWTYLIMEKFGLVNIQKPLYFYRYNPNSITGDRSDNLNKKFSYRIVGFLVNQRRQTGTDDLEKQDHTELNKYLDGLKKPYIDDPSLYYREMAAKYYHEGLKKRAIRLIIKAIRKNPNNLTNYKDLMYILRKILFVN